MNEIGSISKKMRNLKSIISLYRTDEERAENADVIAEAKLKLKDVIQLIFHIDDEVANLDAW